MHIVVRATPQQQEAFRAKGVAPGVRVDFVVDEIAADADACFDLCYEEEGAAFAAITDRPVFVNAVVTTTQTLPSNYIRINAWNGFLERGITEIAAPKEQETKAGAVLDAMGWQYQLVPDVPGMIAARVIAMIINEAYFGWGDGISSKKDIDTAMKLGTNYPYGPFEWAEKIGLQKIGVLLETLSVNNSRYAMAPALRAEIG